MFGQYQVQPQGADARDVAVGEPAAGEPGQLRVRPGGGGGGRQEARGHRDRHLRLRGARAGRGGRVLRAAGREVRGPFYCSYKAEYFSNYMTIGAVLRHSVV